MVTLTFQCTSLSQLREEMAAFLNGSLPPQICAPAQAPTIGQGPQVTRTEVAHKIADKMTEAPAPAAEAAPEKKRRGRKAKEPEQTVYESPANESESSTLADEASTTNAAPAAQASSVNAAAPIVNKEAVHQALQQVNVAVGLPKAREILQSFGVNRISEVKDDQFKAFIEKCNEAVMLEG